MTNARSITLALLVLLATGAAQETKLQVIDVQEGVVLVRGFLTIGDIGGWGTVTVIEILNTATSQREYGITIDVLRGDVGRMERSFIDYEEIDPLIKGIDDVGKVKRSVTKLDEFQAEYRTKGGFGVSVFSEGKKIRCSISSGGSAPRDESHPALRYVSNVFDLDALGKLKDLLRAAKLKLDAIRGS